MAENITPLIQEYIVDFASNNNFFFVKGVQGDGNGTRYVHLKLSNSGQPYVINKEYVRAVIRGTKPDTKEIFNECEIIDESTIKCELTNQMLAVAGRGEYEISIMSTTENRTLTSFPFFVITSKSSFDASYVTSSDEFTLLISKINQVDALSDEVELVIEKAEGVIDTCEDKTELCVEATDNANTATSDLRVLEKSVKEAESARNEAETLRQTNTSMTISNAEKATSDAEKATKDLRELEKSVEEAEKARDEAETLRQTNTSMAISNTEKATKDANTATENANEATSNANTATGEAQKRIDEYDSLNLLTVTENALKATSDANVATESTSKAITDAEQATAEANEARDLALKAVEDVQGALGIDDTQESETLTWSSKHIKEVVTEDINSAIESLTVDSELSAESENPVQNKVIYTELEKNELSSIAYTDTKILDVNTTLNTKLGFIRAISANEDLNNITQPGVYTCIPDNAGTLKNTFYTNSFILLVYTTNTTNYLVQEQTRVGVDGKKAYRARSSQTDWVDWSEICMQSSLDKLKTEFNEQKKKLYMNIVDTTNTSFDDYVTPGIYRFTSSYIPTDSPGGNIGWLMVLTTNNIDASSYIKQIWYRLGAADGTLQYVYTRIYRDNAWTDWISTDKEFANHTHNRIYNSDGVGNVALTVDGDFYYLRPYEANKVVCGSSNSPWSKVHTNALEVYTSRIQCQPSYDNTTTYAQNLYVGTSGIFSRSTNTSSRTIKHDIKELENEELLANNLYDLSVYQFKYNDDIITDETDARYGKDLVGFIIEEMDEKYPIAIDKPSDNVKEWSWNAQYLIPPMLKLIQDQKKQLDDLEKRISELENK